MSDKKEKKEQNSAVKKSKTNKEVKDSKPTESKTQNNNGMLIVGAIAAVLVLAAIAAGVGVALFGNDSDNTSSEDATPLEELSFDFETTAYNGDDFAFDYPSDWFQQDGSFTFVYSINPEEATGEEFNDNVNVIFSSDANAEITTEYCDGLIEEAQAQIADVYESSELVATDIVEFPNGNVACVATMDQILNETEFSQEQYFFVNEDEDRFFAVTLTYNDEEDYDKALIVPYTFEY